METSHYPIQCRHITKWTSETYFSEMRWFSLKKMHLYAVCKMAGIVSASEFVKDATPWGAHHTQLKLWRVCFQAPPPCDRHSGLDCNVLCDHRSRHPSDLELRWHHQWCHGGNNTLAVTSCAQRPPYEVDPGKVRSSGSWWAGMLQNWQARIRPLRTYQREAKLDRHRPDAGPMAAQYWLVIWHI